MKVRYGGRGGGESLIRLYIVEKIYGKHNAFLLL